MAAHLSGLAAIFGASGGIGRHCAAALREKRELMLFSRRTVDGAWQSWDALDESSCYSAARAIVGREREDVVLVFAQGQAKGDPQHTVAQRMEALMRVNATVIDSISRLVCTEMDLRHSSWRLRVVVIGSLAAERYSPYASPEYTASKYAAKGLVKHLARHFAEAHKGRATINMVSPSTTQTEMVSEDLARRAAKDNPLGRLIQPVEVGLTVGWMARAPSALNGAVVELTGGL